MLENRAFYDASTEHKKHYRTLPIGLNHVTNPGQLSIIDHEEMREQRRAPDETLKYDAPLDLPLSADHQAWVKQRLAAARPRPS